MDTTTNDQPHTGDCDTCGASHIFDNQVAAEEWQAEHGDLGHYPQIEAI